MQRGDFWVFGYGSLMWRPGFDFVERRLARLDRFRRSFCLWSWHYRGTREVPGLVLGLDWAPNSACTGVALRVSPRQDREVRDYLARRELVSYAYFETLYPVTLLDDDGAGKSGGTRKEERCEAICYIVDRQHEQYAGKLDLAAQAARIRAAAGSAGPNADYLVNTLAHLRQLGIADPELEELGRLVGAPAVT